MRKDLLRPNPSPIGGKRTYLPGRKLSKRQLSLSMRMSHIVNPLNTTTSWNGKTTKFTQSFQNYMYEDTRINSMRLKHRRERIHKQILEIKEKEKLAVFNDIKRKNMIAKFFQAKFGVHANFSDIRKFNQEQLEKRLLLKGLHRKKEKAAVKIQSFYRGSRARK